MFKQVLATATPVVLGTLFCTAGPAQGQQFDRVQLVKGPAHQGTIVGMDRDQVSLELSGVARPLPVNEIVRIAYANEPSELTNGRNATVQRNYTLALQELRKLDGMQIERDVVRQDVEYFKALCQARQALAEGGDKTAAATAMLNFVRAAPQNFHFYDAAEVLGDLAMASGRFADAAKYYGSISGAPWGDYQMRANNAVGRALTANKEFEQALAKYEAVLAIELATPDATRQRLLASVGKALCLGETGKAAEGVALLEDIISKNDPQDATLFARAYNALGKCYLRLNKPRDAVLAFLHTDLLFSTEADSHAEALYHLSKLWTDINKPERAGAARSTLKERYAGSIWANLE